MAYKLIILSKAEKEIEKIPQDLGKKIIRRIYALRNNPRPPGFKKLTDYQSERTPDKVCYRVRQGDYRIIYTVADEVVTVTIVQVKHRKEVYRN